MFLFFYVITFLPPNTSKLTITRYSNTLSCNPIHIASIIRWQASAWIDLVSNSKHFFSSVILLIGWILFYVRSLFFSLLAKLLVLLLCFLSVICVSPELFQTRVLLCTPSHVSRFFRFVNSNRFHFLQLFVQKHTATIHLFYCFSLIEVIVVTRLFYLKAKLQFCCSKIRFHIISEYFRWISVCFSFFLLFSVVVVVGCHCSGCDCMLTHAILCWNCIPHECGVEWKRMVSY